MSIKPRKIGRRMLAVFCIYVLVASFGFVYADIFTENATATEPKHGWVTYLNMTYGEAGRYNWGATYAQPNAGNARTFDGIYHTPVYYAGENPNWIINWGITRNLSFSSTVYGSYFPPNDPENVTIHSVEMVMIPKGGSYPTPECNLSFTVEYPLQSGLVSYTPFDDADWTTSETWAYASTATPHFWDVTSLRNWTISDVYSPYLRFLFMSTNSASYTFNIDYVGFGFSYTDASYEVDYGTGSTENNVFSLIWLLIIFLPALIFGQFIPHIGFCAGMSLMLIILGITQAGFLATTIIGLITIGVVIFKSG